MNIAVIGAGGPAGANVARSLAEAGHRVINIDGNRYHAALFDGLTVHQEYSAFDAEFIPWINEVCREHEIAYLHSQPEEGVEMLARYRELLDAKTLLPRIQTILLCQDKFETAWRWTKAGLRGKPVVKVEIEQQIWEAAGELGLPMWMRATRGAGARGSTPVEHPDAAVYWWRYWQTRGVDWEWMLEEFLPGRDYAWTSLWYEGNLVTSQARERLEYIYPHLAPSGRTGTPTVAVTISNDVVNYVAARAVKVIDPEPHGLYCVDLREGKDGVPRPTEINAGRFFTTSYFYTAAGLNIPDLCARMAVGGEALRDMIYPPQYNALPSDLYWIRHIDCPAQLVAAGDDGWVRRVDSGTDPLWAEWWESRNKTPANALN